MPLDSYESRQLHERYANYYKDFSSRNRQDLIEKDTITALRQFDKEVENIRAAMSWFQEEKNWKAMAEFLSFLDEYFYLRGNWLEAIEYGASTIEQYNNSSDNNTTDAVKLGAAVHRVTGKFSERMGQLQRARQLYFEGLGLLTAIEFDQPIELSRLRKELGWLSYLLGKYDEGIAYCEQSLKLINNERFERETASLHNVLGTIYQAKKEHDLAVRHCVRSLEIRKRLGYLSELAEAYRNLGTAYGRQGYLDKEIKCHRKALELDKQIASKYYLAMDYNNLGDAFKEREDLNRAAEYFEKSLPLFDELGDVRNMAIVYFNLADTLYLSKAKQVKILENLGQAKDYAIKTDYREGLYNYILPLYKHIENECELAAAMSDIAIYEKNSGDNKQACKLAVQALELAKKLNIVEIAQKMTDLREEICLSVANKD